MNKVEQSCSNIPSSGIKLFGATITSIQNSSEVPKRDDPTPDKKPDKIIQCPRCKSMETKFCYFNNYNVNQPRHFCKGCQRYWTAGGALRNVPVGAGRRKTKPPPRPDGYLFDASTVMQLDYLQEWQAGGFGIGNVFPAKRRRFAFDC